MIERTFICDGCGKTVSINSAEERDEYIERCTKELGGGEYEYYIVKPVKFVLVGTVDIDKPLHLCADCMENMMKNCNYIRELRKGAE